MIETPQDIFDAVLEELNKEQTGTIYPAEFDVLATKAQLEWVKSKLPGVEMVQKRIDDLQTLKVTTTGILPVATNTFALPINLTPATPGQYGYLAMLNVGFRVNYLNNPCYDDGVSDEYCGSKPYKADKTYGIARDPYNKPTDDRLYHEIINDQLIGYLGNTGSTLNSARIEYIRYPQDILLANTLVTDIDIPIHARHELVDLIVRKKLEIIGSERYQSFTAEKQATPT